ncbi:hypothetical protein BDB00DRAFT_807971 [Zychaea mexicana]|uniref:uncharacterized protein n=1 Tax=Zychaea mexicana TaxID=64656 RepID=UPI0022FE329C|nr:uncharacterized protein BDB00DRAFT_807971 [Zychaea mexicana]KAI9496598.1 hypothetical protein BDB00DRAFT_807971 [Zychaea mexicana]
MLSNSKQQQYYSKNLGYFFHTRTTLLSNTFVFSSKVLIYCFIYICHIHIHIYIIIPYITSCPPHLFSVALCHYIHNFLFVVCRYKAMAFLINGSTHT